jgi:hypothetical protein
VSKTVRKRSIARLVVAGRGGESYTGIIDGWTRRGGISGSKQKLSDT